MYGWTNDWQALTNIHDIVNLYHRASLTADGLEVAVRRVHRAGDDGGDGVGESGDQPAGREDPPLYVGHHRERSCRSFRKTPRHKSCNDNAADPAWTYRT